MITIHNIEQGTPEWLKLRENLYTGNGAEKLLRHHGQMKYVDGVASAYALAEITGFGGTFWTRRGHELEDEAVELYEAIEGVKVDRPGFVTNNKYPTCGYSPDGLPPTVLLEVKCFDVDHHLVLVNAKKIEDIPLKILAQVHFGLLITERSEAHLIAYCPKKDDNGKPLLPVEQQYRKIVIKARPQVKARFRQILLPGKVAV